ncbi:hypothetical protein [Luteococcus sp.]|uniref:hypothetical protein n=1 Tax=Luteococcus sp. TaxID=1969402 RepID=UPI003734FD84
MFANILRADAYRFVRSRFLHVTVVVFLAVIGLFSLFASGDDQTSFAFGGPTGQTKDGIALVDGFMGFTYADPAHPRFWELVTTATCFTAVTLFAVAITGMVVITADDANGITKVAVAQGQSQTMLFLSKVVLSVLVTAVLWALHNALTLAITLRVTGASMTTDQLWRWAGHCGLLCLQLVVLMLTVAVVALVSRSRVVALAVLFALVMGAIVLGAVLQSHPSRLGDLLLGANPMWHINRFSRSWAEEQIIGHAWTMVVVGTVLTLGAGVAFLRRRELG